MSPDRIWARFCHRFRIQPGPGLARVHQRAGAVQARTL